MVNKRSTHKCPLANFLLADFIADARIIMAKVPILKFNDVKNGFEVDLNCNNAVGIRNTHLLHCYSQMDWRVRPLVIIVKLWAQANNINDAKNMTISSYSLALMVIHYLQCKFRYKSKRMNIFKHKNKTSFGYFLLKT